MSEEDELVVTRITRRLAPGDEEVLVEAPCNVVFDRNVTVSSFILAEEPNPWVFVCRAHFNYEPEQKSIGLPGVKPCPICGTPLTQGPNTVVMRKDGVPLPGAVAT